MYCGRMAAGGNQLIYKTKGTEWGESKRSNVRNYPPGGMMYGRSGDEKHIMNVAFVHSK